MTRSTVALLVAAAGFAFGGYALYWDMAEPAPDSPSLTLPQPASPATASVRRSPAADISPVATRTVSKATVDQLQNDIAALKEQIVHLRAQVSTLQRQARDLERAAAVNPSGADSANHGPDDLIVRQEAERQRQEALHGIETAFQREPVSAGWHSEAASVIEEALGGISALQGAVQSVECRSQTCRVELWGDPKALTEFVADFALQVGTMLPSITANQVENGEDTTLILYLSRHAEG